MIDWNKPIEFDGPSGWMSARVLCADRRSLIAPENTYIVLWDDRGTERAVQCSAGGKDGSHQVVRNVVEKPKTKRVWTVTLMNKPKVAAKLFDHDPQAKIGAELPGFSGYTVVNVTETELAA